MKTMWSKELLVIIFSLHTCHPNPVLYGSVFLEPDQAGSVLQRYRRHNSGWLEELQRGDLQRECVEERCSYEEAREVFEHNELTDEFWKLYTAPDPCQSHPCLHGGSCLAQSSSFFCLCPPQFSGLRCELDQAPQNRSCLLLNGGCQHFCLEDDQGWWDGCSCAEGYELGRDGRSCEPTEPFPCGWVPALRHQMEEQLRIVGGEECPRGECPWQVLLVYKGKGFCGGVIYKPSWIITAAHCLQDVQVQFLQVVAGEHDLTISEGSEQTLSVQQMLLHPDFDPVSVDGDLALLRLSGELTFSNLVLPACLPTRQLAESSLWEVQLHTVSGWGRRSELGPVSSVLRRTRVPRLRSQTCQQHSGVKLTPNMFCAGYLDGRTDSCKGDSGGPLMTRYAETNFLLGIVSWGRGCARPGSYGIYTRLSNYLGWIRNQTREIRGIPERPSKTTSPAGVNLPTDLPRVIFTTTPTANKT